MKAAPESQHRPAANPWWTMGVPRSTTLAINPLTSPWNTQGQTAKTSCVSLSWCRFQTHWSSSGQLSFMYLRVELVPDRESQRLAAAHKNLKHVWPALQDALHAPGLYDAATAAIHAGGHAVGNAGSTAAGLKTTSPRPQSHRLGRKHMKTWCRTIASPNWQKK